MDCATNPTTMICTCDGKQDTPYKIYDPIKKVYNCCSKFPFPILSSSYPNVKLYLSAILQNYPSSTYTTGCDNFYTTISNMSDSEIKTKYEELYELLDSRRLLNNSFYPAGDVTISTTPSSLTCGVSYYPAYLSFRDDQLSTSRVETYVCVNDSIIKSSTKDVDFSLYHVKSKGGTNCTDSICYLGYPPDSNLNIGDLIYNNSTPLGYLNPIEITILVIVVFVLLVIFIFFGYWMKKDTLPTPIPTTHIPKKRIVIDLEQ